MDVNRTQGIAPVQNQSGGNAGREHHDDEQRDDAEQERSHEGDAFEIEGLAAEITPAAQRVLDELAAEIEPLRRQLEMARERERNLREDLARHAFLPVPGRREFVRELNHVLNHLDDLAAAPSIVILHVANAEDVRREYGRAVLDKFLVHVADGISRLLQPTRRAGQFGGQRFRRDSFGSGYPHGPGARGWHGPLTGSIATFRGGHAADTPFDDRGDGNQRR